MGRPMLKVAGTTAGMLLGAVLPLGVLATPALARPIICDEGHVVIKTWDIAKHNRLTHLSGRIRIDPGATFSNTVTRSHQHTYGSGIETSLEASASANGIIASAEVKAGVKLQKSGSWTTRKDITRTWSMTNRGHHSQVWVLYSGTKTVTGQYRRKQCVNHGMDWNTTHGGWRSWTYEEQGAVKCPSSARRIGSLPWLALRARGC